MKKIILVLCFVLTLSIHSFAQENLLERVPELQELAARANGGACGCGTGEVTFVTSKGEIKTEIYLDPICVFGRKIVVADLVKLLEARVKANKTGIQNQMSGEVKTLVAMILYTLAFSKDSMVIPVISDLFEDNDKIIRSVAIDALLLLARANEELKNKIEKIYFPKEVVEKIKRTNQEMPTWVKIRQEN